MWDRMDQRNGEIVVGFVLAFYWKFGLCLMKEVMEKKVTRKKTNVRFVLSCKSWSGIVCGNPDVSK